MALRRVVKGAAGVTDEYRGLPSLAYLLATVSRSADILFLKPVATDLTAYDTKRRRFQIGAESKNVVISGGTGSITFPKAFTVAPIVIAWGGAAITLNAAPSATGFVVAGADATVAVHYIAVGV